MRVSYTLSEPYCIRKHYSFSSAVSMVDGYLFDKIVSVILGCMPVKSQTMAKEYVARKVRFERCEEPFGGIQVNDLLRTFVCHGSHSFS